jgi:hypothetical protein
VFVVLNRQIFQTIRFFANFRHPSEFQTQMNLTWAEPAGNWLMRFYEPGLALFAFICLLLVFNYVRRTDSSLTANPKRTAILIAAVMLLTWSTISYPWVGVTALFIGLFQVFIPNVRKFNPLESLLFGSQVVVAAFWLLFNLPDDERTARLGGVEGRTPEVELLIIHAALLAFIYLPIRKPVRSIAAPMVIASTCAVVATPLLTNNVVGFWHFLFIPTMAATAMLTDLAVQGFEWVRREIEGNINQRYPVAVFTILIVGFGMWHLTHSDSDYYFVPTEISDNIEVWSAECERHPKPIYSRDPGVWWELAGRTTCINPVSDGLSNDSNQEIAESFVHSMLDGGGSSRELVVQDISQITLGLGDSRRGLARQMISSDEIVRLRYHGGWWLYHSGMNNAENSDYISSLLNDALSTAEPTK